MVASVAQCDRWFAGRSAATRAAGWPAPSWTARASRSCERAAARAVVLLPAGPIVRGRSEHAELYRTPNRPALPGFQVARSGRCGGEYHTEGATIDRDSADP